MARFYLDANIATEVADFLTAAGHETVHAVELGHGDQPDRFHLRQAASQAMILVTVNRGDFRLLHRFWQALVEWGIIPRAHGGILTATREPSPGPWVEAMVRLIEGTPDPSGQLFSWHADTGIWHRDRF